MDPVPPGNYGQHGAQAPLGRAGLDFLGTDDALRGCPGQRPVSVKGIKWVFIKKCLGLYKSLAEVTPKMDQGS